MSATSAASRQRHREQAKHRKATSRTMPPMYVRPYPPYLPGHVDPAWGVAIKGRDLAVGDTLVYIAEHHKIDRIVPYEGRFLGPDARTACSGTWEIAVAPDATVRILPREAA